MAINWINYGSGEHVSLGLEWNMSTTDTTVSIAPVIYRWDEQNTDNSGSTYKEELWYEPDGSVGEWGWYGWGSGSGERQLDSFNKRTYQREASEYTVDLYLYTDSSFGTYYGGWINLGSQEAHWSITVPALATYTVQYNLNGGSGSFANQTKTHGTNLTLRSGTPTRANYAFSGWKGSDGNTYQPGATYTGNAALTLTAQWTIVSQYSVVYHANGGSGSNITDRQYVGSTLQTRAADTYTRANYTFKNWTTKSDGGGTSYNANVPIGGGATADQVINLYAQWNPVIVLPNITGISATRTNSSYTTPDDDGSYAKITYTYKQGTSGGSPVSDTAVVTITPSDGATASFVSGLSGGVVHAANVNPDKSYTVTIQAKSGSTVRASASVVIPSMVIPFDIIRAENTSGLSEYGIGIGKAPSATNRIESEYAIYASAHGMTINSNDATQSDNLQSVFLLSDASDKYVGRIAVASDSYNNSVGTAFMARRQVGGTNYDNMLKLLVGSDGSSIVRVTDAAPWRQAVGIGQNLLKSSYLLNGEWERSTGPTNTKLGSVGQQVGWTVGNHASTEGRWIIQRGVRLSAGTKYTASAYVEMTSHTGSSLPKIQVRIHKPSDGSSVSGDKTATGRAISNKTGAQRMSVTITPDSSHIENGVADVYIGITIPAGTTGTFYVSMPQLEENDIATPWTFSGEYDTQNVSEDYIVAQGTCDFWTYRMWKSGVAECWGTTSEASYAVTTDWGSLYVGPDHYNYLPGGHSDYAFSEQIDGTSYSTLFKSGTIPIITVGWIATSWAICGIGQEGTAQTNLRTSDYFLLRPDSATCTGKWTYYCIGVWK